MVNFAGNYKPPHLARVNQVTETFFIVQWLKGSDKRKWALGVAGLRLKFQKESVIYFDIQFYGNDKLTKEAALYLRRRYKELARQWNRFTVWLFIVTSN